MLTKQTTLSVSDLSVDSVIHLSMDLGQYYKQKENTAFLELDVMLAKILVDNYVLKKEKTTLIRTSLFHERSLFRGFFSIDNYIFCGSILSLI